MTAYIRLMQPHSISVIIPTFNRDSTIVRSINSVRFQTEPVHEIIVVDDGSTDSTEKLVKSINDSRIKYIKQAHKGANHARNLGIQAANSFWIAFQDSDDVWFSNKIEKILDKIRDIESRTSALINRIALFHSFYRAQEGNEVQNNATLNPEVLIKNHPDGIDTTQEEFDQLTILLRNFICPQNIVIPRDTLLEIGGFDTTIVHHQDWELGIRIAAKTNIVFLSEPLVFQYVQQKSISNTIINPDVARKQILEKHADLYKQRPFIYLRQKLGLTYRSLIN